MFYIKGLSAAAQLVRPEQRVPDGFLYQAVYILGLFRVIYKVGRKKNLDLLMRPPHLNWGLKNNLLYAKFLNIL